MVLYQPLNCRALAPLAWLSAHSRRRSVAPGSSRRASKLMCFHEGRPTARRVARHPGEIPRSGLNGLFIAPQSPALGYPHNTTATTAGTTKARANSVLTVIFSRRKTTMLSNRVNTGVAATIGVTVTMSPRIRA